VSATVYLIAGSAEQAAHYAREELAPGVRWRYVRTSRDLRGLRGADVRCVGNSYDSPLWRELGATELYERARAGGHADQG
jgi:hypothetical protein